MRFKHLQTSFETFVNRFESDNFLELTWWRLRWKLRMSFARATSSCHTFPGFTTFFFYHILAVTRQGKRVGWDFLFDSQLVGYLPGIEAKAKSDKRQAATERIQDYEEGTFPVGDDGSLHRLRFIWTSNDLTPNGDLLKRSFVAWCWEECAV